MPGTAMRDEREELALEYRLLARRQLEEADEHLARGDVKGAQCHLRRVRVYRREAKRIASGRAPKVGQRQ